jgi:hypothetical protein
MQALPVVKEPKEQTREEAIAENKKLKAELEKMKGLVDAHTNEFRKSDGTYSIHPSSVRLASPQARAAIRKQLNIARRISQERFHEVALLIADEYQYEPREVYTFFHSP